MWPGAALTAPWDALPWAVRCSPGLLFPYPSYRQSLLGRESKFNPWIYVWGRDKTEWLYIFQIFRSRKGRLRIFTLFALVGSRASRLLLNPLTFRGFFVWGEASIEDHTLHSKKERRAHQQQLTIRELLILITQPTFTLLEIFLLLLAYSHKRCRPILISAIGLFS